MDAVRIDELRRRIDADPTSIAFAELAEEYRRSGRFQDAILLCRTGLARHPAYLSARVTLGRALTEVGELPSARAELEQVLRVAPASVPALKALADVHQRLGDPETADRLIERASASAHEGLDLHDAGAEIARHLDSSPDDDIASGGGAAVAEPGTGAEPALVPERTPPERSAHKDARAAELAALERFLSAIESASRRVAPPTSPR